MSEAKHPSELNLLQQYHHTVKVAKTTSRLKNPSWYKDALELDVQVHCYLRDDSGMDCYLFLKQENTYRVIEGVDRRGLERQEELEKFIDRILGAEGVEKPEAIGVILYLAEELSLAGLGPEYQNPGELDELRAKMIAEPTEVLDDKTVSSETHAWRLLPYPGAPAGNEFATAVAVSKTHDETLRLLRGIGNERNLPIRTCALSAPLCAIAALPWFTTAKESGTVTVFNYTQFTLLAFFDKQCDLMMLRYMPHPHGASAPANLGPAVMATATAFELETPEINVVSMVGNDVDGIVVSLQSSMMGADIMLINKEEVLKSRSLPKEVPLEVVVTTQELDGAEFPLVENATFSAFREEGWTLQDFLAPSKEELEMFPSEGDMKLLRIGRKVKLAAAVVVLGIVFYSGVSGLSKIQSSAWHHKAENTVATALQLNTSIKRYEHWKKLLKDRSKAWVSMELIARLAPADGSVMLKDVKHKVSQKTASAVNDVGLVKSWVINGYANEKGLLHLEGLSTREGVKKLFNEVAGATGNQAYLPDVGQRDITVNLKQRPNPTYNSVNPSSRGDVYRLAFTLTISQSIPGEDEMALSIAKAPGQN